MKINGVSVRGLFLYKSGVESEINDILYFKGNLYRVISPYDGLITPDRSTCCVNYLDDLYRSGDVNIITASNLVSYLRLFLDGIGLNGSISMIDESQIDEKIHTGVYKMHYDSSVCLVRVYNLSDHVVQEIVNYSVPYMKYRCYYPEEERWTEFKEIRTYSLGDEAQRMEFETMMNSMNLEVSKLYEKCKLLKENHINCQYSIVEPDETGIYWLGVGRNYYIKFLCNYRLDDGVYQAEFSADPESFDDGISTINTVSNSKLTVRISIRYDEALGTGIVVEKPALNDFKVLRFLLINKEI